MTKDQDREGGAVDTDESDDSQDAGAAEDEFLDPSHLAEIPNFTSDAELSFVEALTLARRRGVRLFLPMGEVGTGKTTIMVELWTHLVGVGAIAMHRCAGSRTAMALEERAFLSRMAAGVTEAETPRTHIDENEGLLHLRIARPNGNRVELLLADYSGERFRHIREGAPLLNEFPWAARADRVAILIDGSSFETGGPREIAINDATRQLYALRESKSLHPSAKLAIVLAKDDQVTDEAFEAADARLAALMNEARGLDPEATLIRVAARPADGSPPMGLDKLLEFLCSDERLLEAQPVFIPSPTRSIARYQVLDR